ncbi:MAG: hypothetical protein RDV41_01295 [Planctomycetota bacterium]|nr:hypothetical protein [Planctomycetota bacterium]
MGQEIDSILANFAVDAGFLQQQELDECLNAQRQQDGASAHRKLTDLLLEKNYLSRSDLDFIAENPDYVELRARGRKVGARVIEMGFASPEQVASCLAAQKEEYLRNHSLEPLGTIMRRHGFLSEEQRATVLANLNKPGPGDGMAALVSAAKSAAEPTLPPQTEMVHLTLDRRHATMLVGRVVVAHSLMGALLAIGGVLQLATGTGQVPVWSWIEEHLPECVGCCVGIIMHLALAVGLSVFSRIAIAISAAMWLLLEIYTFGVVVLLLVLPLFPDSRNRAACIFVAFLAALLGSLWHWLLKSLLSPEVWKLAVLKTAHQ